jgi:hypothetical protein
MRDHNLKPYDKYDASTKQPQDGYEIDHEPSEMTAKRRKVWRRITWSLRGIVLFHEQMLYSLALLNKSDVGRWSGREPKHWPY